MKKTLRITHIFCNKIFPAGHVFLINVSSASSDKEMMRNF